MIFFLLTSISSGFAYICVSHEVAGLYVRSTEHHVMSEWMKMCVNCFCFAYFFINFLRNLLSLDYFSVYLLPQSLPFHTTMCVYFLYLSAAWHCATLDFWEKRGRNSMPFFFSYFTGQAKRCELMNLSLMVSQRSRDDRKVVKIEWSWKKSEARKHFSLYVDRILIFPTSLFILKIYILVIALALEFTLRKLMMMRLFFLAHLAWLRLVK